MKLTRRPARLALALTAATAIVLGAGVSGAAASSDGPGRSGSAHAEHGHPNPDAVRGHDEEGKTGKGHESHGNGHGYGHGDHSDDHSDDSSDDSSGDDQAQGDDSSGDDQAQGDDESGDDSSVIVDQPTSGDDQSPVGSDRDGNPVAQIVPVEPSSTVTGSSVKSDIVEPAADETVADSSEQPAVFAVEVREVASEGVAIALAGGSSAGVILRTC